MVSKYSPLRNAHCIYLIVFIFLLNYISYIYDGGPSKNNHLYKGLWLWCLTPLSTIFQLCRGSHLYKASYLLSVLGSNPHLQTLVVSSLGSLSTEWHLMKNTGSKSPTDGWNQQHWSWKYLLASNVYMLIYKVEPTNHFNLK